jgi:NADH:ubiquinone oxidoreductase subunit 4 (subunit M)
VESLSKIIIIIIIIIMLIYVGHSPQQTVGIIQENNKELVTQNETFGIINTVNFSMINVYTHFSKQL